MVKRTKGAQPQYYVSKEDSKEPYYVETGNEKKVFRAAFEERIPVIIKGPTGCGKTRFVKHMAYTLRNEQGKTANEFPLVTVSGHEDLSADDLLGRHLINGKYIPGEALVAVQRGGILYLDEIVEARQDTVVIIHPLTSDGGERILTVPKLGETFAAPDSFMVVMSYNPGYQKKSKDLKISTKQRFVTLNFGYPSPDLEGKIIEHEANIDDKTAASLVQLGNKIRQMKGGSLQEGASTRLLIHAGKLIRRGIDPKEACTVAVLNPLTDDIDALADIYKGTRDMLDNIFE